MPPPLPEDQVDMDYEELIHQLEEENAQLRKESKYWQEQAHKFMARLTEVIYWYEGDAENVFGEEGGSTEECEHDEEEEGEEDEDEEDEGEEDEDEEEEDEEEEDEETWREWWEESGEEWKEWWDMGVKQLEW
jgi:hypothetical protein